MRHDRSRLYRCLMVLIALQGSQQGLCLAKPSDQIQRLIDTPATAFDVYLHKLSVELNRETYLSRAARQDRMWLYRLDYDADANVLELAMHVLPSHDQLDGFEEASPQLKKNILLTAARDVAMQIGIEPWEGTGRKRGVIQRTRIQNGLATASEAEDAFKEEISRRTEFVLNVPELATSDGQGYSVRRTLDGQYQYEKRPKR